MTYSGPAGLVEAAVVALSGAVLPDADTGGGLSGRSLRQRDTADQH